MGACIQTIEELTIFILVQNKLGKLMLGRVSMDRDNSCHIESAITYKKGEIFEVIDGTMR